MLKCSFFSVSRTEGLLTNPLYYACAELSLSARHLLDAVNNIVVSILHFGKYFFVDLLITSSIITFLKLYSGTNCLVMHRRLKSVLICYVFLNFVILS